MKHGISSPRARRVARPQDQQEETVPRTDSCSLPASGTDSSDVVAKCTAHVSPTRATTKTIGPPPTAQNANRRRSSFVVLPQAFETADNSTTAKRKVSIVELMVAAKKEEEDAELSEDDESGRKKKSKKKTSIWDIGDIFGGDDEPEQTKTKPTNRKGSAAPSSAVGVYLTILNFII